MTALAARALLILLAAVCAVVAVSGLRSDHRCRQAAPRCSTGTPPPEPSRPSPTAAAIRATAPSPRR